jgi:hypothetical protein
MVTLDFSKCKTPEDVEDVFKKKETEIKLLRQLIKRIEE